MSSPLCTEVIDNMADVLDGSADQRLVDHIAGCDTCRDARHDAERGRALVARAGDDFVVPADLEARLAAALAKRKPAPPAPAARPARPRDWRRLGTAAGVSLAAAAALALAWRFGHGVPGTGGDVGMGDGWHGQVTRVSRAGGGAGGLVRCDAGRRSCAPIEAGGAVDSRSLLRTDGETRAYLRLADGSQVAMDRSTEIVFGAGRHAVLTRGAIAADVAHLPTGTARFDLPQGHAEVLGTKFALRADDAWTSVDVSRGAVALEDRRARSVTVRAGEEGRIFTDLPPDVGAAPDLGQTLVWGEATGQPEEETSARGLGELRAKKPGSQRELDRAVRLSAHAVKVRIAGAVARTEVDETFSNDTGEVLEGIYRFPLPPDAKIERLALEVDGRMVEGAFVDRDRAAAIWRGAIAHAAPQMPKPKEEIIWVPGPWRDPALLEWQRGGRFELRIFPIPRHGSRRIVLAYTQTLSPAGGMRRYAYPLAHDPAGSTRIDRFDVDVQVRGQDPQLGVRAYGYPLRRDRDTDDGAAAMAWSARGFVPAGDLLIMFAPVDRGAELSAWAYREGGAAQTLGLSGDSSTVALALRPRLPRVEENARRDFVLIVDSSRSMFGETYQRAVRLAARFTGELDPADRVTVLACDSRCRALPGGFAAPGPDTAARIGRFLAGITPDGASDVAGAIAAAAATGRPNGGALRIVYFGDGAPTIGPVRPASLTRAVAQAIPAGRGTVTAVAIGAESDLQMLGALARGGGGVALPYAPGQTTAEAAFAVLGSVYGNALRDVTLSLPEALHEVAPQKLDTIPAGGEAFVVARLAGAEAAGTVVLRGKVGARDFEQRYPLRVTASTSAGNAFVPRLFAAVRIADLERDDAPEAKQRALELSSRFNVASRWTSLLVLESPAMFRAFGLDNNRTTPEWTGEEASEGTTADGEVAVATKNDEAKMSKVMGDAFRDGPGRSGYGMGGLGAVGTAAGGGGKGEAIPDHLLGRMTGGRAMTKPAASRADDPLDGLTQPAPELPKAIITDKLMAANGAGHRGEEASPAPPPVATPPVPAAEAAAPAPAPPLTTAARPHRKPQETPAQAEAMRRQEALARARALQVPRFVGNRRMIPMRRIWERVGAVVTDRLAPRAAGRTTIANLESRLGADENRRDLVKRLYTLHMLADDVDAAGDAAERWAAKAPLDPEALRARADVAARRGDRDGAIRILGSVVEVRPDDAKAQGRLARLWRWAGEPALGCRPLEALAELHPGDAARVVDAVRCARRAGLYDLADDLIAAAEPRAAGAIRSLLDRPEPDDTGLRGDLRVEAVWSGEDTDLDLTILDPHGQRVSWFGGPTRATLSARDAVSPGREALALRGAGPGEYVIEINRQVGDGEDEEGGIIHGEVIVTVAGARQRLPFTLRGQHARIALANITLVPRLVPLDPTAPPPLQVPRPARRSSDSLF
ncbi:MAG TPA: VIT domain-containing protein [Polyangia bacterium]|nr:VIT domain-containing protein [Polyangia bacterium]